MAPLIGAFLSDTYLGRFWTISIASLFSFLAMVLLTLTAIISSFRPPACSPELRSTGTCHGPSSAQYGLVYLFFALFIVGIGGSCRSAFGADQFLKETTEGMNNIQTFFNWYYFGYYSSIILATTVIVYIQANVSWAWGFGICAALTGISVLLFLCGAKLYTRISPGGSPFTGLAQVVVACVRKRHLDFPSKDEDLYYGNLMGSAGHHLTQQLRFLSKAAIKTAQDFQSDGQINTPWSLCTVEQVEELKSILRTLPIWSSLIIPTIMTGQHLNFMVLQALEMDRHLGPRFQIPAASFMVFTFLSSTILLPIYEKLMVPFAARKGIKFTYLQRIGTGMFIYCVGLGVVAIAERKRLNAEKMASMVPMSALWLIPQNVIMGLADPFQTVGQIDFFYNEFPETVRSTAIALVSVAAAVGHYLSSALVNIVHKSSNWLTDDINQGHLDYLYALLCALGVLNFAYFMAWAHWYKYKA